MKKIKFKFLWNRFKAWFYHWNYDQECAKELSKLCPYCELQFKKWCDKNGKQ